MRTGDTIFIYSRCPSYNSHSNCTDILSCVSTFPSLNKIKFRRASKQQKKTRRWTLNTSRIVEKCQTVDEMLYQQTRKLVYVLCIYAISSGNKNMAAADAARWLLLTSLLFQLCAVHTCARVCVCACTSNTLYEWWTRCHADETLLAIQPQREPYYILHHSFVEWTGRRSSNDSTHTTTTKNLDGTWQSAKKNGKIKSFFLCQSYDSEQIPFHLVDFLSKRTFLSPSNLFYLSFGSAKTEYERRRHRHTHTHVTRVHKHTGSRTLHFSFDFYLHAMWEYVPSSALRSWIHQNYCTDNFQMFI